MVQAQSFVLECYVLVLDQRHLFVLDKCASMWYASSDQLLEDNVYLLWLCLRQRQSLIVMDQVFIIMYAKYCLMHTKWPSIVCMDHNLLCFSEYMHQSVMI